MIDYSDYALPALSLERWESFPYITTEKKVRKWFGFPEHKKVWTTVPNIANDICVIREG